MARQGRDKADPGETQRCLEGGSGGGASDVRRGASTLNDRIIVAGGGGGKGEGGKTGKGGEHSPQNPSSSQRTCHIDVRVHFVRDFIEDDILKVIFVRSDKNVSDMFTKNVGVVKYHKHSDVFMYKEMKHDGNRKDVQNT